MSVSLLSVWRAARARAVPFTGENAGYLVFLACEELALAPRSVSLSTIGLEEDGGVRLAGREASDDARAERELRTLLAQLLEVASSPGIALTRAATRPPSGSLTTFSAELTKALIPFNRAAARRALGRLHRETQRALEAGELAVEPGPAEVPHFLSRSAPPPQVTPVPPMSSTPTPVRVVERERTAALPPVMEIRPLPEMVMPTPPIDVAATPSSSDLQSAALASLAPILDSPTRPQTVAALRRREPPPTPEWTEPLPTPLRRVAPAANGVAASTAPLTPAAPPPSLPAVAETSSLETPFLGSLATEVFDVVPAQEPLAFEIVFDDASQSPPPVIEAEPAPKRASDDSLEWPIELAAEGAAIPLEAERDALPEAPEPEPYVGMAAEKSDVRKLLSGFQVAQPLAESDVRSELKRLAGIDETPNPTRFGER